MTLERLDYERSLVVMRQLANVERQVASQAIGLFGVAVRNDRQVAEFKRMLRASELQAKQSCLKALQDFGYLDLGVTIDDLKAMR